MAYCGLPDLERRISLAELVALTDDLGLGQVDQGLVTQVIAEVDGLIDSYLVAQMEVPLANPPVLVRSLSADLALFRLCLRRGGAIALEVKEQNRSALESLALIAQGQLHLDEPLAKAGPRQVRVQTGVPAFGSSQLDRY
ncbi:MAG: hypothetical protein A2600_07540 [Candidatus Lambdaproteobacteria bacterium RIFOXYD1_FULL_56_27]|uniref:Mu-like prophage protein gp36 n=1 Tax=Candidatus Lambdaproteobacteria bacterium RIFOXYD2_FULL_56_26 TaxID=1817773 RepID=A0A1F6GNN6_9PROT|nr:MAG: hypothetical protein A2557_08975 [Candidatus Lambdaproteobacteria bacterium RIFOXYD2_FULL_56_26]OGH05505.1 MAG: hypothetical protein A2426_03915 [Candidatus Lambdaproteobacteria bacterium RIFOXYC1_FULL_56_13]OGH09720.1 MAG: hypothetical protein A2600_07540 [Candidatus Lambdaproteobacteria bacterium RIFOXYD1_FULL_56_27]